MKHPFTGLMQDEFVKPLRGKTNDKDTFLTNITKISPILFNFFWLKTNYKTLKKVKFILEYPIAHHPLEVA